MALPNTVIYFTCYDRLCEALKYRLGKDDEHISVLAGSLGITQIIYYRACIEVCQCSSMF